MRQTDQRAASCVQEAYERTLFRSVEGRSKDLLASCVECGPGIRKIKAFSGTTAFHGFSLVFPPLFFPSSRIFSSKRLRNSSRAFFSLGLRPIASTDQSFIGPRVVTSLESEPSPGRGTFHGLLETHPSSANVAVRARFRYLDHRVSGDPCLYFIKSRFHNTSAFGYRVLQADQAQYDGPRENLHSPGATLIVL